MGGCEVLLQLEKITIYLERERIAIGQGIGESSLGLLAFKMCLKKVGQNFTRPEMEAPS